jgi:hypothetical protein
MKSRSRLAVAAFSAIGSAGGALFGPARLRRFVYRLTPGWRAFAREADAITERHWRQTRDTVAALKQKYEQPVMGYERVWTLVERLALCVDPTDGELLGVSQLVHTRQVVAAMERDGMRDPSMLVAAITHDLGKVLLLMAEAPEHVVGMTAPIGPHLQGIGLDNGVFQWSHDEFVYSRLRDHVPDHVAWLLRYHSILIDQAEPFMDARDRTYLERYLRPFRIYDQGSKSPCLLPSPAVLEPHRELIEATFPARILI